MSGSMFRKSCSLQKQEYWEEITQCLEEKEFTVCYRLNARESLPLQALTALWQSWHVFHLEAEAGIVVSLRIQMPLNSVFLSRTL